ncbi:uncharacterized protein I303_105548 [Kwoniella dejecticola CBS 10117]|uniref:Uncharacterized protein n=1 Tax=Kwoniella dejecticola CBS 10117 TaxID=1296121 RepID=A0A1A6A264_9TREE|nr:uncharacterized protein I303_05009 [Kwoniella dejecticola CBS 10117]OBR84152.1 hypothetical protein I303_05009 [Kwoniella dejecticola CBS 10117]
MDEAKAESQKRPSIWDDPGWDDTIESTLPTAYDSARIDTSQLNRLIRSHSRSRKRSPINTMADTDTDTKTKTNAFYSNSSASTPTQARKGSAVGSVGSPAIIVSPATDEAIKSSPSTSTLSSVLIKNENDSVLALPGVTQTFWDLDTRSMTDAVREYLPQTQKASLAENKPGRQGDLLEQMRVCKFSEAEQRFLLVIAGSRNHSVRFHAQDPSQNPAWHLADGRTYRMPGDGDDEAVEISRAMHHIAWKGRENRKVSLDAFSNTIDQCCTTPDTEMYDTLRDLRERVSMYDCEGEQSDEHGINAPVDINSSYDAVFRSDRASLDLTELPMMSRTPSGGSADIHKADKRHPGSESRRSSASKLRDRFHLRRNSQNASTIGALIGYTSYEATDTLRKRYQEALAERKGTCRDLKSLLDASVKSDSRF